MGLLLLALLGVGTAAACAPGPGPVRIEPATTTTTEPPGPPREVVGTTFTPVPTADAPAVGVVDVTGGEVGGTTADGIAYRLVVSPGAVVRPTEVTIQPLERGGPPFGEPALFSFDLQPEGLTLDAPAMLIVELPTPVHGAVTGLGFFGDDGQGFDRPVVAFGSVVGIQLDHFSGASATTTTEAERRAWAGSVSAAFQPSAYTTADGHRYAEAVRAQIKAIFASTTGGVPTPAQLAAVDDLLQTWLTQRVDGHLLAEPTTEEHLVQASRELKTLEIEINNLSDDTALRPVLEASKETLRLRWLDLYQTYLAPQCSAELDHATDAFDFTYYISEQARLNVWSGFDLPDDDGWCARLDVDEITGPAAVADEEGAPDGATTSVGVRYSLRTPRAAAFAGEPMATRMAEGRTWLAERLNPAQVCLGVGGGSVVGANDGAGRRCEMLPVGTDTGLFAVDPSGLEDLALHAEASITRTPALAATADDVAPRRVRSARLDTPNTVLPSPPYTAPVCLVLTEVDASGATVPSMGVTATLSMAAGPGSAAQLPPVSGPTDDDGRLCSEYSYDTLVDVQGGSTSAFDRIDATWPDLRGTGRTTQLVLEPDWIDIRIWPADDPRPLGEKVDGASPTSFGFAGSRFSSWQAALVRRNATPEAPTASGAAIHTPDAGTDGTSPADGGIRAWWDDQAIAVGGVRHVAEVGIDLQAPGRETPSFRVCACLPATEAGSTVLHLYAELDGVAATHDLDLSWPQFFEPPPPDPDPDPDPVPPPDPGPIVETHELTEYLPSDGSAYVWAGNLMAATYRYSDGTLFFTKTVEVEGVNKHCPREDWVGSFSSSCGWTTSVGDITYSIVGGSTRFAFDADPHPFSATTVARILRPDGQWNQVTSIITFVPGEDPNPDPDPGGGPGGGGGDTDTCEVQQAHVHRWQSLDNAGET